MADNTTLNTGSGGDVISTDDIAGVKVQRVKVQYGADGSATDVAAATPLPVDDTKQQSTTGTVVNSSSAVILTGLTGGSATVFMYGTHAGITVNFGISPDGTNWFPAMAHNIYTNSGSPNTAFALSSNSSTAYVVPLNGASQVRVLASAYTSGTLNVVIVSNGFAPINARQVVDLNTLNTQTVSIGSSGTVSLTGATSSQMESSAARTSSGSSASNWSSNGNSTGLWLVILVTAVSGTSPTMTVRMQWSPDVGTTYIDWDTTNLQTATINATGTYSLKVGPGIPTVANASLQDLVPSNWRLAWTIGGTTPSFTFGTRMMQQR